MIMQMSPFVNTYGFCPIFEQSFSSTSLERLVFVFTNFIPAFWLNIFSAAIDTETLCITS